jgi:DNA polymerase I-like protein with 3'-5' exonuclease and polymerase domains
MAELPEDEWKFRVLELVLILRAIRTRRSLYYVPYPKWVSPIDGMIHPGLRNCGTVTRRPSGSSPNILQVSKIKDEGKMRSTFLPHTSATIWRRAA